MQTENQELVTTEILNYCKSLEQEIKTLESLKRNVPERAKAAKITVRNNS
jgi:hypothetical protein